MSAFALLALLALGCGPKSSWERAVARSNEGEKPLIVEFYATWCGPCTWFEKNVLPHDDVVRELESVEFVRYDFDSTVGRTHARRLGVRRVPTFVSVGANGKPYGALQGAKGVGAFIDYLRWSVLRRRELMRGAN